MRYKAVLAGAALVGVVSVATWFLWPKPNPRPTNEDVMDFVPYEVEKESPRTINDRYFTSRSLAYFPDGTSDEDAIAELRAHLEGVAEEAPDQRLRAYVFLRRVMEPDLFEKIVAEYGLTGGPASEVRVLRYDLLSTSVTDLLTSSASSAVESFVLWGTAPKFLSAWQRYPQDIRGILTLGSREQPHLFWDAILPGRPLNAGSSR